jgi:uncharacterized membrane protein SirB2
MMLATMLHVVFAIVAILMFVTRAVLGVLAPSPSGQLASAGLTKFFKIAPHIVYTVVLLAGLSLLFQLPIYPHWVFAKIVLFLVAISASVKAFRQTATANQFKMGIAVASVAYVAILWLALAKPVL